jgi:hypothetical protein
MDIGRLTAQILGLALAQTADRTARNRPEADEQRVSLKVRRAQISFKNS